MCKSTYVAPLAGMWIETSESRDRNATVAVAPHAGARIETVIPMLPRLDNSSRPMRARGYVRRLGLVIAQAVSRPRGRVVFQNDLRSPADDHRLGSEAEGVDRVIVYSQRKTPLDHHYDHEPIVLTSLGALAFVLVEETCLQQ